MKKYIAICLVCLVILSAAFAGCAYTEPDATPTPTPRVTTAAPAKTVTPTEDVTMVPENTPDTTVEDVTTSPDTSPEVTADEG